MANIATSKHDDALDIVQDAMMTLVRRYIDKPADEWPALFYRILQNRIRDWYRRQAVMRRLFFWQTEHASSGEDENQDSCRLTGVDIQNPQSELQKTQLGEAIDHALAQLPLRQQQTFLLRAWEGLDVKQTAAAMNISEGSVKTHYSRALDSLQQALTEHEVQLK